VNQLYLFSLYNPQLVSNSRGN